MLQKVDVGWLNVYGCERLEAELARRIQHPNGPDELQEWTSSGDKSANQMFGNYL